VATAPPHEHATETRPTTRGPPQSADTRDRSTDSRLLTRSLAAIDLVKSKAPKQKGRSRSHCKDASRTLQLRRHLSARLDPRTPRPIAAGSARSHALPRRDRRGNRGARLSPPVFRDTRAAGSPPRPPWLDVPRQSRRGRAEGLSGTGGSSPGAQSRTAETSAPGPREGAPPGYLRPHAGTRRRRHSAPPPLLMRSHWTPFLLARKGVHATAVCGVMHRALSATAPRCRIGAAAALSLTARVWCCSWLRLP
jgi:hypothetical protein